MTKVIVSFSGGMDSLTVLAQAIHIHGKENVTPVGFSYGSKHNKWEHAAAQTAAEYYGVRYSVIQLQFIADMFQSNLLLSGGDIPEGHYEAETMKQTVVPCRNLIFASILAGLAESEEARALYFGVHAGDHAIYPDCREDFFKHLRQAVFLATNKKVELIAPFLFTDKVGILQAGMKLCVPYHLSRTCYKDQPIACGKCGSCQERLTAFHDMVVPDPLEYESREILPK